MKPLFKILFLWAFLASSVSDIRSQPPPLAGFVFVNAIGVKDKANITASGKRLTTNGVAAGIASSGLGLPIGNYQIQVTAPGCEPASTPLQLSVGSTPILIAYLERITDPRTKITKNFIRLLQIRAEPETEKYVIKALSVDSSPLSVTAGGQTQSVEFRKPVTFEAKKIKVADSSGSTDETSADEKGSYYGVLFHKADGKVAAILVPERIYQW